MWRCSSAGTPPRPGVWAARRRSSGARLSTVDTHKRVAPAYPDRRWRYSMRSKPTCTARCARVRRTEVGALRLVLSELQKAEKEGADDELAVLRRERKRRLEAAHAYREAGHENRAGAEEAEGELIAGYLPAELSDGELRRSWDRRCATAARSRRRTWVARWARRWRPSTVAPTASAYRRSCEQR